MLSPPRRDKAISTSFATLRSRLGLMAYPSRSSVSSSVSRTGLNMRLTINTDDFFIHPLTPLVFGVVYFVVAKVLSHRQNGKNRIKGKVWDALVIAHNVALAAYSAWT